MNNPEWLGRARAQTFTQLTPEDQDRISPLYADWLWFEQNVNMQALAEPEFNALCYLLDVKGPVTVLRGFKGRDKQEVMKKPNTQRYKFKAWW